jgi:putative tryptophan/tyrosine transport system substrate-binding protein
MKRREFISFFGGTAAAGLSAWFAVVRRARAENRSRVGFIFSGSSAGDEVIGFKQGLRELGYVEGQNIDVEYRFAENNAERLPEFAADLARLNPSVIVAIGTLSTRAARHAAPDTPVVFLLADAIGTGIVTNLRKPGGNIKGASIYRPAEKYPELAKQVLPRLTRVGYLFNPMTASSAVSLSEARHSAEVLGLDFRSYPVERPEELEKSFAEMQRDGIGFLFLDAAHPYPTNWPRVAELALTHKLPALSEIRQFPLAGGLMSYGAKLSDMTRLLAQYVDRILKGTKAGDLPVEQPTRFELVINLKTAKALGLTIPDKLLTIADDVIE